MTKINCEFSIDAFSVVLESCLVHANLSQMQQVLGAMRKVMCHSRTSRCCHFSLSRVDTTVRTLFLFCYFDGNLKQLHGSFFCRNLPHNLFRLLAVSTMGPVNEWFQTAVCGPLTGSWDDGHVKLVLRRRHLLADSVQAVLSLSREDLRKRWRLEMVNEPALDAGGVTREWFQLVTEQVMDPDFGLWTMSVNNQMCLNINPASGAYGLGRCCRFVTWIHLSHMNFHRHVVSRRSPHLLSLLGPRTWSGSL